MNQGISNRSYGDRDSGGYAGWGERREDDAETQREEELRTVTSLKEELKATIPVRRVVWEGGEDIIETEDIYPKQHSDRHAGPIDTRERVVGKTRGRDIAKTFIEPDTLRRDRARQRLSEVYQSSKYNEVRISAGKALGYSKLRILFRF